MPLPHPHSQGPVLATGALPVYYINLGLSMRQAFSIYFIYLFALIFASPSPEAISMGGGGVHDLYGFYGMEVQWGEIDRWYLLLQPWNTTRSWFVPSGDTAHYSEDKPEKNVDRRVMATEPNGPEGIPFLKTDLAGPIPP